MIKPYTVYLISLYITYILSLEARSEPLASPSGMGRSGSCLSVRSLVGLGPATSLPGMARMCPSALALNLLAFTT